MPRRAARFQCIQSGRKPTSPISSNTFRAFRNSPPPSTMGNAIGAKRKTAKVMKIDGTTIRFKAPATAGDVLRDHPGYSLLESEEVRQLGIRARPLPPDQPLKPKRLYFLVELPRLPDQRVPRRAWSGALHVSAKERLESLMLSRRAVSDLSVGKASVEDGAVRLKMRLPRSQVARLVAESKDSAEAAEKIANLCVANNDGAGSQSPTSAPHRREKRTRFLPMPDEITV